MSASDKYFDCLARFQLAMRAHDYLAAARWANACLPQLAGLVRETRAEYGRFDISFIPALEVGASLPPAYGDCGALEASRRIVEAEPTLRSGWGDSTAEALDDCALARRVMDQVALAGLGLPRSRLRLALGIEDGRRLSALLQWMAKVGRLTRTREGRDFRLIPVQSA